MRCSLDGDQVAVAGGVNDALCGEAVAGGGGADDDGQRHLESGNVLEGEGGLGPDDAHVADEAGPIGDALGALLLTQVIPGGIGDHASEELLDLDGGVTVDRDPTVRVSTLPEPWHRGLVRHDGPHGTRQCQGRGEGDDAAEAVPDEGDRAAVADLLEDALEVLDVVGERRCTAKRAGGLVAPSVEGDAVDPTKFLRAGAKLGLAQ